ncbi:MAG TPA: alpha/beta hydrolase [Acidimicrobiales bacterium]|nr:alpha/beta hydrolase [Acidimicrobiales bacterium]
MSLERYMTRRVAGVGGVELAVDLWPAGPAGRRSAEPERPGYLLVHGLASNARLYDGVAAALVAAGHSAATVDLRGHGRSAKPDDGYDYETMCADLVAVLDNLAKDPGPTAFGRPVVVGQSFGGNLVVELAHRHPDKLSGIVGIDGGMFDLRSRFSSWEEAEQALAPPRIDGMRLEELERRLVEMHPDWPPAGIAGTLANFEVREDGTIAPWLTFDRHLKIVRTMWESSPQTIYPEIIVPVLFLLAESPAAPAVLTAAKRAGIEQALGALAHGEVKWFSPADHDVHAQHPDEVAAALLDFGRETTNSTIT